LLAARVEDPVASNRANREASTRLCVAAARAGVQRLVYSSSSAVYGGTDESPADEERRERPLSPYGMNKLAAEQLFRMSPGLWSSSCRSGGTARRLALPSRPPRGVPTRTAAEPR
jgi:nucleoside-diphosphate-sugar epimerase